jgi:hypothetical protein
LSPFLPSLDPSTLKPYLSAPSTYLFRT